METEEPKKQAVFLSAISASNYKLLFSFMPPDNPRDKAYSGLVAKFLEHFATAPSEIVEHSKFHTRCQKPGELVTSYLSELHSIAKCCIFEGTLKTMLRGCIVCGINDGVIQHCVLSRKKVTFKTASEIAQGMESAAIDHKYLTTGI